MIDNVVVSLGDPKHHEVILLLKESQNLLIKLFPLEDNYAFSIDELCAENVKFFVASFNKKIIGCGAISIKPDYGEIKSMFVDKSMRGNGVAQKILDQINLEAKKEKLKVLRLETGLKLEAAVRIYIRNGFSFCNCFGEYVENKTSIFMEKSI
jgi:putative acetyltransferase